MKSQWDDWLRELAAQQMGGRDWSLPAITPGYAWNHAFSIAADVSADSFRAQVRINPDADTALAVPTLTVGSYADGVTPITLVLSAVQVAAIVTGTGDGDLDGIFEAVFDLFHTPDGADEYRAASTNIVIAE